MPSDDTKYGDQIADDHWERVAEAEAEPESIDDQRPPVEVDQHTIWIDDNREATGYEYGIQYIFSVEEGTVVGWTKSHYLEGRTQADYMATPSWDEIPTIVREAVRRELDVEEVDVDAPDFYGERTGEG